MSDMERTCPGCGRHCDLSNPHCPRGEAYARGEEPAPRAGGNHHGEESAARGEKRHRGEERPERDRMQNRPEHHDREKRGEHHHREEALRGKHGGHEMHRKIFGTDQYASLDTDGKILAGLRELGHLGRSKLGSRGGQGRILQLLSEEGTMTQRDLTERLGIQPGSASEVIGKLEKAGLVERKSHEEDRRTANIILTDAGKEAAAEKQEKPELLKDLTEEEKQQFLSILERILVDWQPSE